MNFMLFYDKKLYRILPSGLKLERIRRLVQSCMVSLSFGNVNK